MLWSYYIQNLSHPLPCLNFSLCALFTTFFGQTVTTGFFPISLVRARFVKNTYIYRSRQGVIWRFFFLTNNLSLSTEFGTPFFNPNVNSHWFFTHRYTRAFTNQCQPTTTPEQGPMNKKRNEKLSWIRVIAINLGRGGEWRALSLRVAVSTL